MSQSNCPECGADVEIQTDAMVHEIIACEDCGSDLEVTSLQPVQLGVAPEIEEDWGE